MPERACIDCGFANDNNDSPYCTDCQFEMCSLAIIEEPEEEEPPHDPTT